MEKFENLKLFLLEHRYILISMLLIAMLISGIGGLWLYQTFKQEDKVLMDSSDLVKKSDEVTSNLKEVEESDSCYITVDIKGEVKLPGIYQVECDSRVQDAINLTGGLTWKADTSILNLSKKLTDEMVIIVYSKEEVANFVTIKEEEKQKLESCPNETAIKNDACIDSDLLVSENEIIGDTPVNNTVSLNKASKEDLMTLPGIGASKADDIINYRNENGGFKSIEDIKNVKGIGDKVFEKIKANITV